MFEPPKQALPMHLVSHALASVAAELANGATSASAWAAAQRAIAPLRAAEPELAACIDAKDAARLQSFLDEWKSGERHLPEQDREVLRRALKAFRKTLKVTRLDAESSIGGGPMSSGRHSAIVGITPPERYGREVWDELVRQGRLLGGRHGVYELPPE